jgi:DNA-binding beta-propeller fold protein YncE
LAPRAALGGLPEGIVYSPNSDYLYVANYFEKDLQVFQLGSGKLTEVGPRLKLPGRPASMRAPAR